jgi:hypothetical protein
LLAANDTRLVSWWAGRSVHNDGTMSPFDEIARIIELLPLPPEEAILRVRQLMTAAIPGPAPAELIELVDGFYADLEQAVLETDATGIAGRRNELLMALYALRREASFPAAPWPPDRTVMPSPGE